jgi:cell division protein FtsI/penicillin-binding protein 2
LEANLPLIKTKLGLTSGQETLENIATFMASRTNISRQEILDSLNNQVKNIDGQTTKKADTKSPLSLIFEAIFFGKKSSQEQEQTVSKTKNYGTIKKSITEDQAKAINILRNADEKEANKYYFDTWLSQPEQINVRNYPENKLLSQTLGYSRLTPVNSTEAKKIRGCKDMVVKNQDRGTELLPDYDGSYQVGDYGLEQKYCSVLAGLNGRPLSNKDLTDPEALKNGAVQNGADLYLTIDKNIQKKAEQVLEEAVAGNTNNIGSPKDGCIMVMEASTGKILAMASYPSFDPNYYSDYLNSNSKTIVNSCTRNDFEVGSVMKPLTVAAALNLKQTNYVENGEVKGVDAGFKFTDYDSDGKPYRNGTDTIKIKNARNFSWKDFGQIGLKEIIRDSINTGIGEVVDKMGNKAIKEYFLDKLEFGHYGEDDPNLLNFAGDMNGNTQSFETDINCVYCYAAKGFGQGFSISVLQLVRAYTAIANGGNMTQPQIVEKIQCSDGTKDDLDGNKGSCIPENTKLNAKSQKPVFTKITADLVTSYMLAANEEGFLGGGPTKAMVDGYRVAIKSGTAQVSRPIILANGDTKPCSQDCNTMRGIYDHTMIGFNTGASRYIVMIKLAEPKPGQIDNFSSTTLAPYFADMVKYTLEYLGIPKER